MDLGLAGKKALVTGSYRGTGLVIAKALLLEGVDVFVHGFDAEAVADAIDEIGGGNPVVGDIRTDAGAVQVLDATGNDLDILVNNYGTAAGGRWDTLEASQWVEMLETNVLSAQRLIRGYLPAMRERAFARIINLGTAGSTRPNARNPHYYAAKAALANLTVSLAKDVAGTAIRVNIVSPGMILTPEVQASYLARGKKNGWGETWEEVEPHFVADIPIRRITTREEVADLVVFLASTRSDAIHGQNLRIDGGVSDFM